MKRAFIYSATVALAFFGAGVFAQQAEQPGAAQQQQTQPGTPPDATMPRGQQSDKQAQKEQRRDAQQQQAQQGQGDQQKDQTVVMLVAPGSQTYEQARGDGCWVQLYRDQNFSGQPVLIDGPISVANLGDRVDTGWWQQFGSLQAGEKARVTLFTNENFEDPAGDVKPGEQVANLSDEKFGWFESAQSIRVQC